MKVKELIYLILIVILGGFASGMFFTNKDLKNELARNNELFDEISDVDSAHENTKDTLAETIKEYRTVTRFVQGDKVLSDEDIVKLINERYEFKEKYLTSEVELQKTKFNLRIASSKLEMIKKRYDIEYITEERGDEIFLKRNGFGKADSGLLLLPSYRSKLSKKENVWHVSITKYK